MIWKKGSKWAQRFNVGHFTHRPTYLEIHAGIQVAYQYSITESYNNKKKRLSFHILIVHYYYY
jgi:hypothetical protein